jgi:hypothetical protein
MMIRLMVAATMLMALVQAGPAAAAPQILGLLTTSTAQPLFCEDGNCQAVLTSYCLQPDRRNPWAGYPYQRASNLGLEMVAQTRDGRQVRQPLPAAFKFVANEPVASVIVKVDQSYLQQNDFARVSIEVTEGAALLPVVKADDPRPLTKAEIALATGPGKKLGSTFFEDGPMWGQSRLLAALMSPLPERQQVASSTRQNLWDRAIDPALEKLVGPAEVLRARTILESCTSSVDLGVRFNVRSCIADNHRSLIWNRNEKLWKALKPMF